MMEAVAPAVIAGHKIGDGQPCFITLEAGPTHDGLQTAKQLADIAAQCGADAIKFQIFDPDRLVADRHLPFSYEVLLDEKSGKTESITEPLYDILCRRALPEADWWALKKYCDDLGLLFFATVSDDSYFGMIEKMQLPSLKVASADVNHTPFLRQLAKTGSCIQLDTGNATLGEIETAIDVLRQEGNDNVIVHNCPSGYPARLESINLKLLRTIKQVFQCPAAYSDHTPGWEMDIAALAMGADLLEKTITLDRTTRSVEHIMSLEPQHIRQFIQTIRDVETAMGKPRRILSQAELEKRQAIRRSVYLVEPVSAGQTLAQAKVEFRRPGFGLSPQEYERFQQASFQQALPAGTQLNLSQLNLS